MAGIGTGVRFAPSNSNLLINLTLSFFHRYYSSHINITSYHSNNIEIIHELNRKSFSDGNNIFKNI